MGFMDSMVDLLDFFRLPDFGLLSGFGASDFEFPGTNGASPVCHHNWGQARTANSAILISLKAVNLNQKI